MAADIFGGVTINITAAGAGKAYTKVIMIDTANFGEYYVTFTGANINWNSGVVPSIDFAGVIVITSANNKVWGSIISVT